MNENIDLTRILKNCPKGTEFYSTIWGKIFFELIIHHPDEDFPVRLKNNNNEWIFLTKEGKYNHIYEDSECILFPSKEQRDWNKFTAPWYKKERFDPNTLKPFDKVLVRPNLGATWFCTTFSHTNIKGEVVHTASGIYAYCIPYNEDTMNLVGTRDEPSEYYRYWEN